MTVSTSPGQISPPAAAKKKREMERRKDADYDERKAGCCAGCSVF